MRNINIVLLIIAGLGTSSGSTANDWPQACYNETSMWVTNACKEYIETVYYAAPGPDIGSGMIGFLLVSAIILYLKK